MPYAGVGVVTVSIANVTDMTWNESDGMFKFTHSGINYYMKISADGEKEVDNTTGPGIASHSFITDGDTYLYLSVGLVR